MLLSSLIKNGGVEITPKIRALIEEFGDRLIPEQFIDSFMERIDHLLNRYVVGFTPKDSLRKGNYESTTLDRIFSYTSEDFAKKFPKFEVLFLKIWCLIHTSYSKERLPTTDDLRVALDLDSGKVICYQYERRPSDDTVRIFLFPDSARIEIEANSNFDPIITITIS